MSKLTSLPALLLLLLPSLHAQPASSSAARPVELKWGELSSLIRNQKVSMVLPDATMISGEAIVVREDALVIDVKKTSNASAYPARLGNPAAVGKTQPQGRPRHRHDRRRHWRRDRRRIRSLADSRRLTRRLRRDMDEPSDRGQRRRLSVGQRDRLENDLHQGGRVTVQQGAFRL